jgi:hypothetical protein
MDDETLRYIAIRKDKQAQLRILDEQASKFGELYVPPYIEMQRVSLREELTMVETAIQSPARSEIGDELGTTGRFLVYHQQNREIRQSVAALAIQLETFIEHSEMWRNMHRQMILIIGIAVIVMLIALAVVITYLITIGVL